MNADPPNDERVDATETTASEGADEAEPRAAEDDAAPANERDEDAARDLPENDAANDGPADADASGEEAGDDGAAADDPGADSPGPVITVAPTTLPSGDVTRAHLKGLVEALVFASDRPLTIAELAKAAGAERKLVKTLADELSGEYATRGIHLDEVAGGWLFRTNPAYAPFVRDTVAKKPVRMTRAQIETLAIVAYKQPITRPEIDDVRGVDCGPVLKMLLERDLVKILGKKDEPGRPLLYGTTPTFLEMFGLKSLKDLPTLREFTELSDDSLRVLDRELGDASLGVAQAEPAAAPAAAIDPAAYEVDPTDVARADASEPEATAPTEPTAEADATADAEDEAPLEEAPAPESESSDG